MSSITQVIGIDPGLADTGIVSMTFNSFDQSVTVESAVLSAATPSEIHSLVMSMIYLDASLGGVFVEEYRPRQKLGSDTDMLALQEGVRARLPRAVLLPNMGIRRVIKKPLMEMMGVWSFTTTSHHHDLRSAARIALLGMTKDTRLNLIVAEVVWAHIHKRPWKVVT